MPVDLHQVTVQEIEEVKLMGYIIDHSREILPHDFLNRYFSGLEFYNLLKEIDDLLTPPITGTVVKVINMSESKPAMLLVDYYSENNCDEADELTFSRSFIKYADHLVVDHDYFSLPIVARTQGIAKKVLACCMKQYLNMNIAKIRVIAGLQDGGYVWARAGFKATKQSEMEAILLKAKRELDYPQFSLAERLYWGYYNSEPDGVAFPIQDWSRLPFMQPILKGSTWHGEIDLTDPEQLLNFNNYVIG